MMMYNVKMVTHYFGFLAPALITLTSRHSQAAAFTEEAKKHYKLHAGAYMQAKLAVSWSSHGSIRMLMLPVTTILLFNKR